MKKTHTKWFWLALLAVPALGMLLTGCEGFFGKKTDPSFIDVPIYDNRQVAYVPIQPVLDGFISPVDVIAGYDELIYIVDEGAEQIISLDQSGIEVGRITIPGVKTIVQDRSLDILAIGTVDTTVQVTIDSVTIDSTIFLDAIYRLDLKNGIAGYNIGTAEITNIIIHPFYSTTSLSLSDANVHLNGIYVRANGDYFVTRSSNRTNISIIDDAVLRFNSEDEFVSPVTINTSGGFFLDYFKDPHGITGLAQPPQSPFVNEQGDFIVTSLSDNATLKVQYIDVIEVEGTDYQVSELLVGDTTKADRFLYEPNRFATPFDVTYTGDGTNYIFVVDSERDSLYQFTNTGLEGVRPPAGSPETKNIMVSFGGTGTSLTEFNQPSGVAYLDRIVYVADKGNGRVLRFKLTTDFD